MNNARARYGLLVIAFSLIIGGAASRSEALDAEAFLPARGTVELVDLPNDNGTGLVVTWPTADVPSDVSVMYGFEIAPSSDGPFHFAGHMGASGPRVTDDPSIFGWFFDGNNGTDKIARQYLVISGYTESNSDDVSASTRHPLTAGQQYWVRMSVAVNGSETYYAETITATPRQNWLKWNKLNNLVFGLVFGSVILVFIRLARRNPDMYIRKIAGLDAVEEALGRATEMGKPVYFVHGIASMGEISTIAAVNILRPVAKRVAEYDTTLKVMNNDPIVMAVSQEVVEEGCIDAGRPDAYNEDNVMFVADRQFSYAAAVDGMMVRERPATVMLMGYFYAESLLFTETGGEIGAIQIAGTDAYTQLPFFITTCDYTLMGEELYAASAYLAREPKLLGSLRGQDVGKAILLLLLGAGTVLELLGINWIAALVQPL
ncbi:MAG TPA: hypothetical protein ENN56_03980 [Firmicutes bacterium]|nr:hypothetical protein [Bacillota bacterium]